ncbi:uncharacterized protein LOC121382112 [Gigantopelta aegis]|uniref:uncharacterized protein LOC121382112 n=1 Tax=Gigantopelta aegis TaxID=1735272 RepID=UPI001B88E44C|nr:uncharacterized protein LOC121382112 [Gigantopelta aegis]
MISFVFLCLVGSVHLIEGVVTGECPRLPCPNTSFCSKTAPTYFLHNGMKCKGCDECIMSAPSKKAVSGVTQLLHICPMVMCTMPPPCDVPLEMHHMKLGDLVCPTCQSCPQGHETGPAPVTIRLKKDASPILACPKILCMVPNNHCSVPLQISKMTFLGHECAGCPYCPTDRV